MLLGGRLFATNFSASRCALASPCRLTILLEVDCFSPCAQHCSLFFLPPLSPRFTTVPHDGYITPLHSQSGLLQQLLTARSAVAGYVAQSPANGLLSSPVLLSTHIAVVLSGSGAVSSPGGQLQQLSGPASTMSGSRAWLPPPRHRRPPVPLLSHCSSLCRSSEPRSSHVTKKESQQTSNLVRKRGRPPKGSNEMKTREERARAALLVSSHLQGMNTMGRRRRCIHLLSHCSGLHHCFGALS